MNLTSAYFPFELRNLADLYEKDWFGETILLKDAATRERYAQKLEEIAADLRAGNSVTVTIPATKRCVIVA